jgi:hypothetical protein
MKLSKRVSLREKNCTDEKNIPSCLPESVHCSLCHSVLFPLSWTKLILWLGIQRIQWIRSAVNFGTVKDYAHIFV